MFRFDVTWIDLHYQDTDGVDYRIPYFDLSDVTLGQTVSELATEFDCAIPLGRSQLAWATNKIIGLEIGTYFETETMRITRIA